MQIFVFSNWPVNTQEWGSQLHDMICHISCCNPDSPGWYEAVAFKREKTNDIERHNTLKLLEFKRGKKERMKSKKRKIPTIFLKETQPCNLEYMVITSV